MYGRFTRRGRGPGGEPSGFAAVAFVLGLSLRPVVHRKRVLVTTRLGVLVGATARLYELVSGNSLTEAVLGQVALPGLVGVVADHE